MTKIDQLRQKTSAVIFVIYLRYLIGGAFIYAGLGKAMGERFMPVGSLQIPPIGMTIDVFFETLYRTGIWWQFLGWGQLGAGLLLVTQRWAALGAIAFLPVSVNIFLITLSMDFNGTPLITGLVVLANLVLLGWDYTKLSPLLRPNRAAHLSLYLRDDQLGHPHYWERLGFLLALTSISFGNRANPMLWFCLCFLEGLLGWVIWWIFKRNKVRIRQLTSTE